MTWHGFINLLKPPGLSSHAVVNRVRRILGTRAVGHAGTLDPAASGVLPLAVGKATRLLEYVVAQEKIYVGEATFGVATDTLDQAGQIVWQADVPPQITAAALESVLQSMVGPLEQTPPAYSAIKHRGRPLYEYARAGETVAVRSRKVFIYSLTQRDFKPEPWPQLLFWVRCSKGTYVRSLVQEMGQRLGTQATLTFLLREQVGDFSVQSALTLEELGQLAAEGNVADFLLPPAIALREWPHLSLDLVLARRFLQGQRIRLNAGREGQEVAVFWGQHLLGIGRLDQGILAPRKVLAKWEELRQNDNHQSV